MLQTPKTRFPLECVFKETHEKKGVKKEKKRKTASPNVFLVWPDSCAVVLVYRTHKLTRCEEDSEIVRVLPAVWNVKTTGG